MATPISTPPQSRDQCGCSYTGSQGNSKLLPRAAGSRTDVGTEDTRQMLPLEDQEDTRRGGNYTDSQAKPVRYDKDGKERSQCHQHGL
ncbi:hypothetical protein GBAR_LOCUS4991 [Geodia barretti]|uniref:Uncharacterized protein n=1 Tax=Geodia barretti TaxID=519541 RepID=A0AA35R983_GEOBA|nr:hypothetical protein GBAR_LOCUS4991 [Geodia barretti]